MCEYLCKRIAIDIVVLDVLVEAQLRGRGALDEGRDEGNSKVILLPPNAIQQHHDVCLLRHVSVTCTSPPIPRPHSSTSSTSYVPAFHLPCSDRQFLRLSSYINRSAPALRSTLRSPLCIEHFTSPRPMHSLSLRFLYSLRSPSSTSSMRFVSLSSSAT